MCQTKMYTRAATAIKTISAYRYNIYVRPTGAALISQAVESELQVFFFFLQILIIISGSQKFAKSIF